MHEYIQVTGLGIPATLSHFNGTFVFFFIQPLAIVVESFLPISLRRIFTIFWLNTTCMPFQRIYLRGLSTPIGFPYKSPVGTILEFLVKAKEK